MKTVLFCLGRLGDVMNVLPLAYREAQLGNRLTICVAREFESILDGITYADRIVWPGDYNRPEQALQWLKMQYPGARIINAQAYRHPADKRRLTPSYQTEAWRLAGRLEEFGMWPTVFDRRAVMREEAIRFWVGATKPLILVGLYSVSSPLKNADVILAALREAFGETHDILDLSPVKAVRIYDVLGLMDHAACLVTADTVWLHLARASRVPVVALISEGNVGKPVSWFGSVPPPATVASMRYSEASLEKIERAVRMAVFPSPRTVIHVVDDHGSGHRVERAKASWVGTAEHEGCPLVVCQTNWEARSVDGKPYLKDVLQWGAGIVANDNVIIWSNSDTIFPPRAWVKMVEHATRWGACSIRRKETDDRTEPHMGRDAFAFRADWLREHLPSIPDFLLAAPAFDLVLAAFIRKQRGVTTNKENLHHDIFPCEMDTGLILHEPHESSWLKDSPANEWNRKLAREYCAREMPTLKL